MKSGVRRSGASDFLFREGSCKIPAESLHLSGILVLSGFRLSAGVEFLLPQLGDLAVEFRIRHIFEQFHFHEHHPYFITPQRRDG